MGQWWVAGMVAGQITHMRQKKIGTQVFATLTADGVTTNRPRGHVVSS